jgi:DNA-binding transcriptional MocR family regulator
MNIRINKDSETPYYKQIAEAIRCMIRNQELIHGYKMPSERKLAAELGIHRNTVIKAYGELVSEGLMTVSRSAPKGYFIDIPAEDDNFTNRFFPLEKMILYNYDRHAREFMDIFADTYTDKYISFGGINMSSECSPVEGMDDIVRKLVEKDDSGNIPLVNLNETERTKKNICAILAGENMYVKPQNIQLVSETTKAINLIASLYMKEGDCLIAEEPIVPDVVSIIRNKGIEIVTVPLEKDGMDMKCLEDMIIKYRPKFVYTMPSYHNPTGIVMSLEKRLQFLEITNRYGVPVIEEDSQRDFRYSEERIPSLYSLDRHKSVVYIDSFTMVFPYGIKTGYVAGPTDMVRMLGILVALDEIFIDNIGQFLLNEYIEGGLMKKHVFSLAVHYRRKRDLMCSCLDKIADKGITYVRPQGGVLIWCTLAEGISDKRVYEEAKKRKVLTVPGHVFYLGKCGEQGHLRLCFSNVSDKEIEKGIALLGEAIDASKREDNDGQNN